jgi:phosphohistidine phosphatase SixA
LTKKYEPALRAKTTAELVAEGCSYQGDIILDYSLYEAKPKDYTDILERVKWLDKCM